MPIITFANPKGGVGKTTSAILAAMELERAGAKVAFFDLDPNANVVKWYKRRTEDEIETGFTIAPRPHDIEQVIDTIESLQNEHDYVIVDLEGTRDKIVTYVLSTTDYVLIPTNGSTMEAMQGADTVKLIRSTSKITRNEIPFSFVFTRANAAFQSIDEKAVKTELDRAGLPYLKARIVNRSPYSQIFRDAKTLTEIRADVLQQNVASTQAKRDKAVHQIDQAILNGAEFTKEVLEKIQEV